LCYSNAITVAAATAAPVAATAAPVTAAPLAPQPALVNEGLPPTAAPGPVITPLTGAVGPQAQSRRLDDDDEARVSSIEIRFKNGLHYEMDHKLMNAMIEEGLFKELEDMPADVPVGIHSYEIRNNKWTAGDLSEKDSLPEEMGFSHSHVGVAVFALAGSALMGVAFVIRRARATYQPVEEDTLLGPVE